MTDSICDYFAEKIITAFVVLPFHGWELVRDFGGKGKIRSLRVFNKSSAVNGFGMLLAITV